VLLVGGASGTGKTSVTKAIVAKLQASVGTIDLDRARPDTQKTNKKEKNVAICFCAFTGRAVQQMKRAIPANYHPLANTINATLGYMPFSEEYFDEESKQWKSKVVFRPTFTRTNKLPYKICIVDEAGMVPIFLWNQLIEALPDDAEAKRRGFSIFFAPPRPGQLLLIGLYPSRVDDSYRLNHPESELGPPDQHLFRHDNRGGKIADARRRLQVESQG
jgi:hypothetical protein